MWSLRSIKNIHYFASFFAFSCIYVLDNSIYYLINSGVTYSERYCGKEYTECYNDMLSISNDRDALSLLNNYVHPFNSFDSITFNFDDKWSISTKG